MEVGLPNNRADEQHPLEEVERLIRSPSPKQDPMGRPKLGPVLEASGLRRSHYDKPCRLCGAQGLKLCYTQGNIDVFRFYRCPQCLLVNYDLATGLNQEKYAQVFRDPLDEDLPMNQRKNMVFKVILRHIKPPARLMDIGCGFGRLLHLARQAGFEVSGLELSQFHAECIKQRLGILHRVEELR